MNKKNTQNKSVQAAFNYLLNLGRVTSEGSRNNVSINCLKRFAPIQASTLTYFSTCPFGQLTKKSTCPTQSFSCPKKLVNVSINRN
jgi:hypothetical protein